MSTRSPRPPKRRLLTVLATAVTVAAAVMSAPGTAAADPPDHAPLHAQCKAFLHGPNDLPHGAEITEREFRDADELRPETCIIRGIIETSPESTITWAVELPHPHDWNGKTLTVGGGGLDGFIPTDVPYYQMLMGPSADPYVRMSSDSGHQVPTFYPWGTSDDALENHGYRANHLTLEVGTYLAAEFFGEDPTHRYMIGHSNGGRSGIVSAQRHPGDYDGIIALQPAISQQAHQMYLRELHEHITDSPDNWLAPQDVALFAEAEQAACDGLDGAEDGIIGDIESCGYDGEDLRCDDGQTEACLTEGQIETIRLVHADHSGEIALADGLSAGYPGFGRGGAATSDWDAYVFGSAPDALDAFNYNAGNESAKVVTGDPDAGILDIDPADFAEEYLRLSEALDPTDHDLSEFADHGGKLLVWYGVADACVSVYRTGEYFDSLRDTMGEDAVDDFARLVSAPGIGHNLDGPGAGYIDFLATMEAWAEDDQSPDDLVASRFSSGFFDDGSEPELQRPLCEWPAFPRYDGEGDPTDADSFVCSTS
jgi:pimeloyl-ACP methyl ester carboxylesterase